MRKIQPRALPRGQTRSIAVRVSLILTLVLILALTLLAYTTTFTVRFTEAAVRTTFGSADESDVFTEPGLRFKAPYPIQSVTRYDTRTRFLQTRSQTQQTADDRQIVVESFCLWRVSDPLQFFRRFSNAGERAEQHYKKAEEILTGMLRSAMAETSTYRMDELFSAEAGGSKLPELEAKILNDMQQPDELGQSVDNYGITLVDVGISSVVLPENTSQRVFNSMSAERDRLVAEIQAEGDAIAQSIRSKAEADSKKIEQFALRKAAEIRAQGEREATTFIKQMNVNPELAVYLAELNFLDTFKGRQITLVLPGLPPGSDLLQTNALDGLEPGTIPRSSLASRWFHGVQSPDETLTATVERTPGASADSEPKGDGP